MMRCPREPVELPPGSHTIRGVVEGDGEDENTFKTKPAELVEIKLLVAPKVTEIIQKSESTPLFDILGWSMIVASGASLGASVFFHNKALDNLDILQDASVTSNFDEFSAVQVDYENDRRIVFALYSMTASTFVAGTVFLLLSDDDDEAGEASIGLDLTPTGVFIRGQF